MLSSRQKSLITTCAIGLLAVACSSDKTKFAPEEPSNPMLTRTAALVAACTGCHQDKPSAIPAIPIANETALFDALMAYKLEPDGTTVMHRLMRGYTEEDIRLISGYYGGAIRED